MSKTVPTRLALDTAEDMFDKLKWEEARLEESWSVYDSFNFIVTAHHLYVDWISLGSASPDQIARKADLPPCAQAVFQAVIDVSNGSKHWQMTHPNSLKRQVIIRVDGPMIGCWYAFAENKPMAYFDFAGYSLSMAELSAFVMSYFEWILHGAGQEFPAELIENLNALRITEPE